MHLCTNGISLAHGWTKAADTSEPELAFRIPPIRSHDLAHDRPALRADYSRSIKQVFILFGTLLILGLAANAADAASTLPTRSIREWVSCNPAIDNRDGVAKAFDAAKNNAFMLVVDCPVFIHVGSDIAQPIYLESDTAVIMTKAGKFIVDNVLVPTWVIANSHNVTLTDWNISYIGFLPTDPDVGGYKRNGVFIPMKGHNQPAIAFNDNALMPWLAAHRAINFDQSAGRVSAPWNGPVATSAIFYIVGSSFQVKILGMDISVPERAGVEHFIPDCFASFQGFRTGQEVTAATASEQANVDVPHDITVEHLKIDGAYMGWLGVLRNSTFRDIQSFRYGDLEDAHGNNIGGIDKWFAPPHLFYFTTGPYVHTLSDGIHIYDVVDHGVRVGTARDISKIAQSGYALSLKIGADNSIISNYVSLRPDGAVDIIQSNHLTVSKLTAVYNSAFLHNLYAGIRFPQNGLHNIIMKDVYIRDEAPKTFIAPIGDIYDPTDTNISLENVKIQVNKLAPGVKPVPTFAGSGHRIDVKLVDHDG